MSNVRKPRAGSMQVWPRIRANRQYPRVRSWAPSSEKKPLGFAGYKVGMTHIIHVNNIKTSKTKGEEIFCPVTVIECPPLKVASVRLYSQYAYGSQPKTQFNSKILDKEIERKLTKPKKQNEELLSKISANDFDDLTLLVYTQPKLLGLKKTPEVFEIAVGGSKEDKLAYAKEKLGKEITVKEVFSEGNQADIHAVTTGKGFQGPMKRFGITRRRHKSEKSIRNPGSLGGWQAQGHVMYRVAHAGQMGYHTRTEYNKQILKIGDKPEEINVKGGFPHFGNVKNTYVMFRGSIAGPQKRLIRFNAAIRPNKNITKEAPNITYVSLASKQ
ncbi:TPA: 50S ribosomal protein L3 [Candidatus Woesearchaeota archaeon]|nr:50S ribosomal protein L3P [uncultured archaeon]MBS3115360.1 50S ribosomal protein L3 [Candidatus Woesearchaeota archaeon]HIH39166.1 50S ribosomal protein L3 [Candidatus Woesearchaeota archaeon]